MKKETPFICKWIIEQLNKLHAEATSTPFTYQMWNELENWYQEKGMSLIQAINPDVFQIEQSFFNKLGSVDLKLKYLMDFPYLTRMYANAKATA